MATPRQESTENRIGMHHAIKAKPEELKLKLLKHFTSMFGI